MGTSFQSKDTKFFTTDLQDYGQIRCVEISPFVLSQDVVLVGFSNKVLLGHLEITKHKIDFDILAEFNINSPCVVLSISPETSLNILPNNIIFATAGSDFKVTVFKSDLQGNDSCKVLLDHSSYVNDVRFDPDNKYLVSVSDDHTAKIWNTDGFDCVATLNLTSPGVAACWDQQDSSKLLVAEKVGLIRFFNVETKRPIISLDYGNKPLSHVHWAPSDSQLVASLQMGELLIWDLLKTSTPVSNNLIFTECGGYIKLSPLGELVAAVNKLDGALKVFNTINRQVVLSLPVTIPTNVCWHSRSSILCVGDYMSLKFLRVD